MAFFKRPLLLTGEGLRTQKLLPDPCILLTALCPEFGSPSADAALLVEADGFVGLGLSFAFVLGGRYLTLFPSSSPKDRGASLARDIIQWREQTEEFQVERKDECGGPLLLPFSAGLDLVSQETLPSADVCVNPASAVKMWVGRTWSQRRTFSILTRTSSPSVSI